MPLELLIEKNYANKIAMENLMNLEDVLNKSIARHVIYIRYKFIKNKKLVRIWMLLNPKFRKIITKISKKLKMNYY